ncbi:unnamed protein product [Parascedosporium putredinis]|uniref:Uncharacterized protein n=1 Tax=Parascedosporium putredinis TaxID=1442378 RepID=A0A9P1H0H9_9PEZI|nr:unnamed protein product [Parascedosporium putredinis]CAI7993954.1 unnamed protein product [Parascedosporium putredinis]
MGGALANPVVTSRSQAAEAEIETLSQDDGVGIEWTGSIFPGEDPVTLYGTVEVILAAILALNPNYQPDPLSTSSDISSGSEPSWELSIGNESASDIEKRQAVTYSVGCAPMATALKPGMGEFNDGTSIPCRDAAVMLTWMHDRCCRYSFGISAHVYPSHRDYSVWLGYGNCNHAVNRRPSTYPYPGEQEALAHHHETTQEEALPNTSYPTQPRARSPTPPSSGKAAGPTAEEPFNFPSDAPPPAYTPQQGSSSSSSRAKPIAIPQNGSGAISPFILAYPPSLLAHGITSEGWYAFQRTISAFLTANV